MAYLGTKDARKVNEAIDVFFSIKKAGVLSSGLAATCTATVYDETGTSFSTPAVSEWATAIYKFSFTPDTPGNWTAKVVESSVPAADSWAWIVDANTLSDDTDDIQTRLPAALVGGRMDSSVGAMAANVITAAAIATDAIGSDEIAASAVTEIQAGLATSAALATVQADTDDIQTRLPASLSGGRMRSQVEGMDAGTVTAAAVATDAIDSDAIAASAVTEIQAGLATSAAVATVQADTDDIQTRLPATLSGGRMRSQVEGIDAGAITAASTAADFSTEAAADTQTGLTAQGYTAARAPNLDNLDATVSSRATPAQVNTEVDTALADVRLDELVQNAAAPATPTANSFIDRITSKDAGQTYDRSTDSLEAIKDSLSGAGPTAAQIADAVWEEAIADHSGTVGSTAEALAAAASGGAGLTAQQVRDAMKLAPTAGAPAVGSVDEALDNIEADTAAIEPLVTANLDATVSSRAVPGDAMALVVGAVTAATVATGAIDADALATDAVSEIADGVWDEVLAGHLAPGTTGEALSNASAGGAGLTAQQVRDALQLAPTGATQPGSVDDKLDDLATCCAGVPAAVDAQLSGSHGAGNWEGGGGGGSADVVEIVGV